MMEAVKAPKGERTIELTVRFFTDDIDNRSGYVVPKHAQECGAVHINANKSHGIKSQDPIIFNSLPQLHAAIERVLIQNGINLIVSNRTKKYRV